MNHQDFSDNLPNLINCIQTGEYTDEDFHAKIAEENGISRSVAKMAAVRCCFNATKFDILQDLLHDVDLSSISTELEIMRNSGLFYWDEETYDLMIQKGHTIEECHSFFMQESEDTFFKYCSDMLTSWDACHDTYHNDLCPSVLAEYSSAVKDNVIREATCDNYNWNGKYKEWAERLLPNLLEAIDGKKSDVKKVNMNSLLHQGTKYGLGNKSRCNYEIREFLKMHNYDVNLAQKVFNWNRSRKWVWNNLIKQGKI